MELPTSWSFGEVRSYNIPHVTIRAPAMASYRQALFSMEGKAVRVEQVARQFLEANGYRVFVGEHVHLYLCVLSLNFKGSSSFKACCNWIGAYGGNPDVLLSRLEAAAQDFDRHRVIDEALLDCADDVLRGYFGTFQPKVALMGDIAKAFRQVDRTLLCRLVQMYRLMKNVAKGVPDLFAVQGRDVLFAEVKSEKDALRPEQYDFIEKYLEIVRASFCVIRVVPTVSDVEKLNK